ncbi:MAG: DUF6799 domain-containing protein [Flavitalea sp.]
MKKLLVLATVALLFTCTLSAQENKMDDKMQDSSMSKGKMGHKMMKDCVMMKDGKMMVMKGGENMAMTDNMTMTNGTMVAPDGSVTTKDGKTTMMKDGECVYMDGKMSKMKGMKSKM